MMPRCKIETLKLIIRLTCLPVSFKRKQLRFVDVQESFHSFQFDDNLVSNNQVETVDASGIAPFVDDWQFELRFERNIAQAKFLTHTDLVDGFQ